MDRTAHTRTARTLAARTAVVVALVAAGFGMAAPAFAADNSDSGGMGACPVVNSDDNGNETTTYVKHGTKLMGLTCKDGTWVLSRAATTGVGRIGLAPVASSRG